MVFTPVKAVMGDAADRGDRVIRMMRGIAGGGQVGDGAVSG